MGGNRNAKGSAPNKGAEFAAASTKTAAGQGQSAVKLLLDTCTFLWLAGGQSLSAVAANAIREPSNEILLSAVSAWEIAVKHASRRLSLPEPPERLIPTERRLRGIATLLLDEDASFHLARLPRLHRDPFDRMLICQAIAHGLAIITPDPLITQYPVRVIW
jgi:PIN domain nuclease of toxin-antitoxin system